MREPKTCPVNGRKKSTDSDVDGGTATAATGGRKTLTSDRVMSLGYIPPVSSNKVRRKRLSEQMGLKQFVSRSRNE